MTIAHVIVDLEVGGAETVLYRLCAADPGHRHFVIVLMGPGEYGPKLIRLGVEVICLGMTRGRLTVAGLRQLVGLLAARRPDVVQTWMYHSDFVGGLAAAAAGVPVVWGIRSGHLLWTAGQRLTIVLRLINAVLSWLVPRAVICNSARAMEIHRRLGYSGRKMVVVPNGIDIREFSPDPSTGTCIRTELGIADGVTVFGTVGRDNPYKDYATLFGALAQLKADGRRFVCVMAGAGLAADNGALAQQLSAAGVANCVILCGPRTDIPALMNAFDVFVLSSAAEAFPSVLIEAMACGVPCVTTDVGDAADVVGDTGWVVAARQPGAMATALGAAMDARRDPTRRASCRARVMKDYTMEKTVARYHDVWTRARAARYA